MKKHIGYAYEVGAYEINTYEVLEINGEIDFKIISWFDFNRKEKIDEYVMLLEEQGYKSKETYTTNKNLVLNKTLLVKKK